MNTGLIWSNLLAWSLQIGLLVGIGALVPIALRIRMPWARLLFWQVLLMACFALPWARGWRQEVVAGAVQVSSVITTMAISSAPVRRQIPVTSIALWLLAAGVVIRLGWLATGLIRLAAYRRRGRALPPELRMPGAGATLLLSDDVAGPVTFGWRDPVILLQSGFPSLGVEIRDAIVCHELLHVERRDWLFTIGEELVRAVLWFHPAVWWLIGEIQLAREQTVDQLVIETTQARGSYVDTLLLMAGTFLPDSEAPASMDLAPATTFLRRRHLKRRLMEAMKEVRMTTISKTRLSCVMGAAMVMVSAVCWLASGAFPLAAAPQVVEDAAGVAVNTNGSQLLHRSSVPYPAAALQKGIEGTVVVQLKLDASGEVTDAAVLSGPDELRKGVIQSVLNWHFDKSAALSSRTINIDFVKPATAAVPARPAQLMSNPQLLKSLPPAGSNGTMFAPPPPPPPPPPVAGTLDHIVVTGLSDSARAELLSSLPIKEGGQWTGQMFAAVKEAANNFDSHLTVGLAQSSAGQLSLRIALANVPGQVTFSANSGVGGRGVASAIPALAPTPTNGVFSVGNGVTPPSVLSKVDPQYSPQALAAKYSGSVMLSIVVGTTGQAEDIHVVKSLGMGLDEMAVEAVQQWRFSPGKNQGTPVNVRAQIEVNFRLPTGTE